MAETKTKPSGDNVAAFIACITDEQKRRDSAELVTLMRRATGKPPRMWGSIVGFGEYHYRYESGHEGDSCLVGFAARKNGLTVYLTGTYFPEQGNARNELLGRLGKHRMGKACLYVRRLGDVDMWVLEELVRMSVEALKSRYPVR